MVMSIISGNKRATIRPIKPCPRTGAPVQISLIDGSEKFGVWREGAVAGGWWLEGEITPPVCADMEIRLDVSCKYRLHIKNVNAYQIRKIPDEYFLKCGVFNDGTGARYTFCGATDTYETSRGAYRALWESIYGKGSWHGAAWVWLIDFDLHEKGVQMCHHALAVAKAMVVAVEQKG